MPRCQHRNLCNGSARTMTLAQASFYTAIKQTRIGVTATSPLSQSGWVTEEGAETNYKQRLGATITELRVIRRMSQAELAVRVGRSEAALSRWENGKAMPSAYDIFLLSQVLD